MGACLDMDVHHHGAKLGSLFDVLLWMYNHVVYIKRFLTLLCHSFQHGEAKRDVGNEDTVHDVQMQPLCFAAVNHFELAVQVQEVSSKQ